MSALATSEHADVPAFLRADGEVGRLIAEHDWSRSLGPVADWPVSLQTVAGLVIRSPISMVLLWGADGVMIYNDAYSGIAGARHPRLLGCKVREGWPEVADFNDNVMKVGLAGGTLAYVDQELTLHRNGGPERVWMNLDYSPVVDETGRPAGVIAVVVETTARVQGERALRESETRLRFLDQLARETAPLSDANEILATTTRMVAEHLGVSNCAYADMDEDEDGFTIRGDWAAPGSPSIVGHYSLADFGKLAVKNLGAGQPLIVNDNLAELAPEEAATFRAIGIAATICMPLVKHGRLTALMAIHDKVPRQWSANDLAVIAEVTERSWAHVERVGAVAELRGSEENFRTLARAIPGHVWTATPDGQLDWFNDQVSAYTGARQDTLYGAGWATIVHVEDLPEATKRWERAVATAGRYEVEFRLRRADGAWRWHLGRAVPILSEDGDVIRWIGTNTDIQNQKETTQALSELNAGLEHRVNQRTRQLLQAEEALRQAQKMEAVGQLTGGIAHDFNNLLAGITGSLELLEKRIGEGKLSAVPRYIDAAQSSARRATALTQRLLAFSRRQTLDPKPLDLNRLVAGMEELITRSVGPGIDLQVAARQDLWTVRADASQLENTLLNLCINARDAMAPDGGWLTIETEQVSLSAETAAEHNLSAGDYVALCVTDTGAGMSPEVKQRAFDPFFTTKPLGQGTGLGLSMIYGFIRQSGGHVEIHTEVGQGTMVRLYLPRYLGAAEQAEPVAAPVAHPGRGETVLVIDDEETVRMLIVEVLEDNGYTVLAAADGAAGLEILASQAQVDLLVTDVGLPGGLNGRQVADAARVARPGLKVLFVTGYAETSVMGENGLDAGMSVITKPFSTTALGARIREIIER